MKIAYIVDSTAGITEELLSHPDVYIMNLTVRFANGIIYEDTTDDEKVKKFYRILKEQKELPTTAQPSPGDYYQLLDQLVAKGYEGVIAIHLSSRLSGTYQTANMVMQEYADRLKIAVIDSKAVSVVIENILEQAIELQEKGLSFDELVEQMNWIAEHAHIYMMIEDLSNLVKGGRLSTTNAFLGGLLQIKPLLEFTDEGEVKLFEKIRTEKRVYLRWEELVEEALDNYPAGIHLRFAHADAFEAVSVVQDQMKQKFPQILSFKIGYLTPVIGVHGGNGVKGIAIIPKANA